MTNRQLTIVLATLLAVIVGGGAVFGHLERRADIGFRARVAVASTTERELPYPEGAERSSCA